MKSLLRVGIAVLALLAVIGLGSWYVAHQSHSKPDARDQGAALGQTPASQSQTPSPAEDGAPKAEEATAPETEATQTKATPPPKVKPLHFPATSASVQKADDSQLKELARQLEQNRSWNVVVTGHADNIGDGHSNLILSRQRAESTAVRLRELGLNSSRVKSEWKSSENPVATNETEQGRAQNRRVEIVVSETA